MNRRKRGEWARTQATLNRLHNERNDLVARNNELVAVVQRLESELQQLLGQVRKDD